MVRKILEPPPFAIVFAIITIYSGHLGKRRNRINTMKELEKKKRNRNNLEREDESRILHTNVN